MLAFVAYDISSHSTFPTLKKTAKAKKMKSDTVKADSIQEK